MKPVSETIKKFFDDFEKDINLPAPEGTAVRYGDSFMFASPQGAQAIKMDDFLKALPKRAGFFQSLGLTSTNILALEETRLDDHYVLVKADWAFHFEKDPGHPNVIQTSATYILFQQGHSLRIVFQLDHQDLIKRVQESGLSQGK